MRSAMESVALARLSATNSASKRQGSGDLRQFFIDRKIQSCLGRHICMTPGSKVLIDSHKKGPELVMAEGGTEHG
ncbi:hypothetical protein [Pseudomonas protegens]|uniref:hypothetical protein n=1 Tax=Pseudomonas protegens TaxID=380021 RepID=UPI000CA941D6|nr:hypothetical protein [Pseudomonas protegens]PNG32635.1 hypothetical protein A1348_13220 [Pseudomonas protegens]